jgi:hypothetical protein
MIERMAPQSQDVGRGRGSLSAARVVLVGEGFPKLPLPQPHTSLRELMPPTSFKWWEREECVCMHSTTRDQCVSQSRAPTY